MKHRIIETEGGEFLIQRSHLDWWTGGDNWITKSSEFSSLEECFKSTSSLHSSKIRRKITLKRVVIIFRSYNPKQLFNWFQWTPIEVSDYQCLNGYNGMV